MRFLREIPKVVRLTAVAMVVLAGGAVGGFVATAGGTAPAKAPKTVVVQQASTTSATSTTTAPAATPAPAPAPTTTTSTTTGGTVTPAPAQTPAPTETTTPTTVARQAPTFLDSAGHACMADQTVGIGGLAGTPAPTGTLVLTGTAINATIPATGGQPRCATVPSGTYTETATYAGDANWLPDTWTFPVVLTNRPGE